MAVTITEYSACKKYRHDGTLDLNSATIKAALVTSSYTPDAANHDTWSDVSANEVATGNGYTTGGVSLTGLSVTNTEWDADNASWSSLTKTFRYIVLYASGTYNGVVDPLIAYILPDNTPADITVTATDYYLVWDASGIATF